MKKLALTALPLIIIILAIWLPRGLELDYFVTVDEPKWMERSTFFYLALATGEFEDTYQKEHPGVTVMWAETAGFLWRFPEYLTEGYRKDNRPLRYERFLEKRKYENAPIIILESGRTFVVLGNVINLSLAFLAAVRLLGLLPALLGFLLIAFDPFSIGLSRLLHPDALLSTFMLLPLLSFMNFLYRGRNFFDLLLAAFATGLAWLTKSPSFFLISFFGLLSLIEIGRSWWTKGQLSWRVAWHFIWPLLLWVGVAALVFVLLWPAMWVYPIDSLQKIIQGAVDYAAEGHTSTIFFNGQIYQAGTSAWLFYPINYLWRTTPAILVGLLLAGVVLIFRRRLSLSRELQTATLILILFGLFYTLFMTIVDKKFDRYLLPIFAPLTLVAAVGWVTVVDYLLKLIIPLWVTGTKVDKVAQAGTAILLVSVVLLQSIGPLQTYPYYLSYYNPLMGGNKKAPEVMMIGWGEGLDQAARYLNAKPDADMLNVQTWYHSGPFSYFFDGDTVDDDFDANLENLQDADYYVVYYHQWQRKLPSSDVLAYFDQQEPEHIVYLNGLEYARIYRRE